MKETLSLRLSPADNMLRLLVKAVVAHYKAEGDKTAASVVVSYLDQHESWYVAVVRYHGPLDAGKEVVCNYTAASLLIALETAGRKWYELTDAQGKSPRELLADFLKG